MKEKDRQKIISDAGGHNAVYLPDAVWREVRHTIPLVGVTHCKMRHAIQLGATDFRGHKNENPALGGEITAKWPEHYFLCVA